MPAVICFSLLGTMPVMVSSSQAIWKSNAEIPRSAKSIVDASSSVRSVADTPGSIGNTPESVRTNADVPAGEQIREVDRLFSSAMKRWQIPGGELAISRNGKLLYACGYGYADLRLKTTVQAESIFRIGSVSKCITAVAVMKLIEDGKLKLTDRVFSLLPEMLPPPEKEFDQGLQDITVADLLNMTAGWDLKKSGEALFMPRLKKIAKKYGTLIPPEFQTICRYELSRKLDWSPGSHFSYSNLSYALLGQIVTKVSGESYADYCQNHLFAPLSLKDIRPAGRRLSQRLESEVNYYPENPHTLKASIFSQDLGERLPAPYGQIDIERYTASFGWAANAQSILRFASAVFGSGAAAADIVLPVGSIKRLLTQASIAQMFSRPPARQWLHSASYVASACELSTDFHRGSATLFKDGTLSGTRAFLICYADGTSCCALFNARPRYKHGDPFMKDIRSIFDKIEREVGAPGSSLDLPVSRRL